MPQTGRFWIDSTSMVYGDVSFISKGFVSIDDASKISGKVMVEGDEGIRITASEVHGDNTGTGVIINGNGKIILDISSSCVLDNVRINGHSSICKAIISGDAIITNSLIADSIVEDRVKVYGTECYSSSISGEAVVKDSTIFNGTCFYEGAKLDMSKIGDSSICGNSSLLNLKEESFL